MNIQEIITKADKPNSYEFGKAGNRMKLYFDTIEELAVKVQKAKEWIKSIEELSTE